MIISLEDLEKAENGQILLNFDFSADIDELKFTKPVKVSLKIKKVSSDIISVTGNIKTKIKAVCDNCLKEFVYNIDYDVNENYAVNQLYQDYKEETEIKDGFFAIDLNGRGEIDIDDLIYQSLILSVPNKLVCDINCIGGDLSEYIHKDVVDPRLEIFKQIHVEKE